MSPPLVSVIIPAYNQEWSIDEAIRSALAQRYSPFEVIVVDDGSTDATPLKIAAFGDRVLSVRQENQGIRGSLVVGGAGARNTGIGLARGEYLAFLDGDDIWEENKLEAQVAAAASHPRSGLLAVDGIELGHDGRVRCSSLLSWEGAPEGSVVTGDFYTRLLQRQLVASPSQVMVPAGVARSIGGFAMIPATDYDFYLRIASRHPVTFIREQLVRKRAWAGSVSGSLRRRRLLYAEMAVGVLRKHLGEAEPLHRDSIRRSLAGKLRKAIVQAVLVAIQGDPAWAFETLKRLWANGWREAWLR